MDAPETPDQLAARARRDLDALAHPTARWVPAGRTADGDPVDDVVIVGAGQSGLVIAAALAREGLDRVTVLEAAPEGDEGPWTTFARMAELRTPKELVGSELGIPSLSLQAWFRASFGDAAWDEIERVPRTAWKAYLDWYRAVTGVAVTHGARVADVRPDLTDPRGPVIVETVEAGERCRRSTRAVVLATGFDGAGAWRVPPVISSHLPPDRYHHTNGPVPFDCLGGARIGVLGHGASAFDNAIRALEAGARSVDLCFRRPRLPRVNPHRYLETAGVMSHYPVLADETRWRIARHFRVHDQPPPNRAFTTALGLDGFRLHPATPWLDVRMAAGSPDGPIEITTPRGVLEVDHVLAATGAVVDLEARGELATLAPVVARWRDHHRPGPGDDDPALAALPYLGEGYEFRPAAGAGAPWVDRVFAFNALAAVSHGPHSTSISGHKHALPRLVRGVTRRLLVDAESSLVAGLEAYRPDDLGVADDFEAGHTRSLTLAHGGPAEEVPVP